MNVLNNGSPVRTTEEQYLIYSVAEHLCAVELSRVLSVNALKYSGVIKGAPPYATGLANYNGSLIVLRNLRLFFSLCPYESGPGPVRELYILVRTGGTIGGIIVDSLVSCERLRGVFELEPKYVKAIGRTGRADETVIMFDDSVYKPCFPLQSVTAD